MPRRMAWWIFIASLSAKFSRVHLPNCVSWLIAANTLHAMNICSESEPIYMRVSRPRILPVSPSNQRQHLHIICIDAVHRCTTENRLHLQAQPRRQRIYTVEFGMRLPSCKVPFLQYQLHDTTYISIAKCFPNQSVGFGNWCMVLAFIICSHSVQHTAALLC